MAKYISIAAEAFEALLKQAKKNGFTHVAERTNQDTAPAWMQGHRVMPVHKIPKKFQGIIDANTAQRWPHLPVSQKGKDVVLPRSSFKNLVEAATAKKPLKSKPNGDDLSAAREIAKARGRKSGLIEPKKVIIEEGPFKGRSGTETRFMRSDRIPPKKAKRVEEEMDLASRRRELRERAQSNKTLDIIDYFLSR